MDLTGWTYLFTFGKSFDVYKLGDMRVAIDRNTGRKVLFYEV